MDFGTTIIILALIGLAVWRLKAHFEFLGTILMGLFALAFVGLILLLC